MAGKRCFKIIKEHDNHFVAHNGTGEFKISKKGLDPRKVGHFQQLAKGGEVKEGRTLREAAKFDKKAQPSLAGHTLLEDTPEHFHVQGPRGAFRVSKKGLSPATVKKISTHFACGGKVKAKKMAKGGDTIGPAGDDLTTMPHPFTYSPGLRGGPLKDPIATILAEIGSVVGDAAQPVNPFPSPRVYPFPPGAATAGPASPDLSALPDPAAAAMRLPGQGAPLDAGAAAPAEPSGPTEGDLLATQLGFGPSSNAREYDQFGTSAGSTPAVMAQLEREAAMTHNIDPKSRVLYGPNVPMGDIAGPFPLQRDPRFGPEVPGGAPGEATPKPMPMGGIGSGYEREYKKAVDDAMIKSQAREQVEIKAAEERVRTDQEIKLAKEKLISDFNTQWQNWQQRSEALMNDIKTSKIDPNRMWGEVSTGGKIAASIGMILSGMGSAAAHQPNYAIQTIDKAIERDIQAQEFDIKNKQTLLGQHMQAGHTLNQAHQLARADLQDLAATQLDIAASKWAGHRNAALLAQQAAQMKANSVVIRQNMAQQSLASSLTWTQIKALQQQLQAQEQQQALLAKLMGGQTGGIGIDPRVLSVMPQLRETAVPMPDGTIALAFTPDDAKKLKEGQAELQSAMASLNAMLVQRKEHGSAWWPKMLGGEEAATGDSMQKSLFASMRQMMGLGILSAADIQILEGRVPNVADIWAFDPQVESKIGLLAQELQDRAWANIRMRLMGGQHFQRPVINPHGLLQNVQRTQ